MKNNKIIIGIMMLSILFLAACNPSTVNQKPSDLDYDSYVDLDDIEFQEINTREDLISFLEENQNNNYYGYGGFRGGMEVMEMALDSSAPIMAKSATMDSSSDGGSNDFSGTNVQVEGVDEADIIKTDGKYIYYLSEKTLYLINAKNQEIESKIVFEIAPQSLYIEDNKLVVLANVYPTYDKKSIYPQKSFAKVLIFDLENIKEPKEIRDLKFEGHYQDSRLIGNKLYLITNKYAEIVYAEDEPITPIVLEDDVLMTSTFPTLRILPIPYTRYQYTTISAIDINDEDVEINQEVLMMPYSSTVYVSENNIYMTYTKYVNEYDIIMDKTKEIVMNDLSEKQKELISKIENTDNDILSKQEKASKIMQIIENYVESLSSDEQEDLQEQVEKEVKKEYDNLRNELQKTSIHKISLNEGDIKYESTGTIPGRPLNQFSMDEKDDNLRIATTLDRRWSSIIDEEDELVSLNNMYVLDSDLEVIGTLEGLAPKEEIKSVRFMGDIAHVVTFERVDPLFVIDLSTPSEPKVLGKLKIPGYSTYLHPYDENHLIGLGYDTKENKWGGIENTAIKLSLFDVSDLENPKEVDTFIIGAKGSSSEAIHEHKAFLFSKDKNLLVIPATIRKESEKEYGWGDIDFKGALVFDIDENGFDLKKKVIHSDEDSYRDTVRRSLYIDTELFTASTNKIVVNSLENLDEESTIVLKEKSDYTIDSDYEKDSDESDSSDDKVSIEPYIIE